jgi:hypothetical protein
LWPLLHHLLSAERSWNTSGRINRRHLIWNYSRHIDNLLIGTAGVQVRSAPDILNAGGGIIKNPITIDTGFSVFNKYVDNEYEIIKATTYIRLYHLIIGNIQAKIYKNPLITKRFLSISELILSFFTMSRTIDVIIIPVAIKIVDHFIIV